MKNKLKLLIVVGSLGLSALPFAASAAPSPCPPSNPYCTVPPKPCSPADARNGDCTAPTPPPPSPIQYGS